MQKVRNNAIYAIRGDTLIFQIDLTKDENTPQERKIPWS